jgi:hypothetical protein
VRGKNLWSGGEQREKTILAGELSLFCEQVRSPFEVINIDSFPKSAWFWNGLCCLQNCVMNYRMGRTEQILLIKQPGSVENGICGTVNFDFGLFFLALV